MKRFNIRKNIFISVFTVVMVLLLAGCSTYTESIDSSQTQDSGHSTTGKILIAYFSHTGNTQKVAQTIQSQVGGDLFVIQTVEQYPLDSNETIETAKREQDNNFRPALNTHVDNISDYDIVFLGYPIWLGNMPMAVYTFLEEYDLSGKMIIPFCTSGGSGLSSTQSILSAIQPNARVTEGISILRDDVDKCQQSVADWIGKLGIPQLRVETATSQNDEIRIRFTFNGNTATAALEKNSASESLISQLPATVTFNDFASAEKIAYFNESLSGQEGSSGYDPQVGDIACYEPWGNMAIYYKEQPYSSGLIYLGKIESGLDNLMAMDDGTSVNVEILQ